MLAGTIYTLTLARQPDSLTLEANRRARALGSGAVSSRRLAEADTFIESQVLVNQ